MYVLVNTNIQHKTLQAADDGCERLATSCVAYHDVTATIVFQF